MKSVLIIEDDSFKANSVIELIKSLDKNATTYRIEPFVDAIELINKHTYDLVLVDMAIPSHPTIPGGGSPMSLLTGGLDVILELRRTRKN